jgi:hypothetical protein
VHFIFLQQESDTLRRGGGKTNATDLDLFFQQTGEFAEVLV